MYLINSLTTEEQVTNSLRLFWKVWSGLLSPPVTHIPLSSTSWDMDDFGWISGRTTLSNWAYLILSWLSHSSVGVWEITNVGAKSSTYYTSLVTFLRCVRQLPVNARCVRPIGSRGSPSIRSALDPSAGSNDVSG